MREEQRHRRRLLGDHRSGRLRRAPRRRRPSSRRLLLGISLSRARIPLCVHRGRVLPRVDQEECWDMSGFYDDVLLFLYRSFVLRENKFSLFEKWWI